MRRVTGWSIWLLILVLAAMLAACDEIDTAPTAQAPDDQAVLSLPTRTLGPIVSFTPRFTATPIPSATFTPSITPLPTDTVQPPTATPTTTPTPTATVSGVIRSSQNVNLREGPGTDYRVVANISPGTELGVLGIQTDARGQDWYKIAYTDDDGDAQSAWVFAPLIDTTFRDVVGLVTPQPGSGPAPQPAETAIPGRVDILAYCAQKGVRPPPVSSNDNVFVEWSWYVSRPEYMDDHLEHGTYEVRLDGELLDDWQEYATDMKTESGVYIIYWYYPVGRLAPGQHRVDFELTWDEAITDGYARFGPETANSVDSGNCTFTVTDAQ